VLNVEPFSGSVGVGGDVVADVGMILGVDPQTIASAIILIGDAPSRERERERERERVHVRIRCNI
jgi:hypothetical protein